MHPVLFTIGKYSVSSYTVFLDLGLILALVLTYLQGKRLLGNGEAALDAGLWTIVGGILGGRIGYVVTNLDIFSESWVRALRIWEGGLSFHGAFLGGLAALILVGYLQSRSTAHLLKLADTLALGLAAGLFFGWIACLLGGSVYGAIGTGFGHALLPDLYGVEASRFATQAFGAGFSLLLLAVFWLLRRRWPFPGAAFLMLLLLYFTGVFFLEFTRGDAAIYLSGWRLAQLVDLALVILAGAGLLALWWRARGSEQVVDEVVEEAAEPAEQEPAPEL
jgi:phosphatidylglycerol---prolipoprotein diacylglyceryl transferase